MSIVKLRVGVVAHEILVSAQGPLVLGFWVFGFMAWCLGLTIIQKVRVIIYLMCRLIPFFELVTEGHMGHRNVAPEVSLCALLL